MAIDQEGAVSVAYGARYESPRRWPIEVQRFDATGALDSVLEAGRNSSGPRPAQPDLAIDAAGDLTAAWRSDMGIIRVRRFDDVPFTSDPVDVAAVDVAFASRGPRLAASGSSLFLAWAAPLGCRVGCSCSASTGGAVFPTPLLLETRWRARRTPAVAMAGPGSVVAWEQDRRIFAQRLPSTGGRSSSRSP